MSPICYPFSLPVNECKHFKSKGGEDGEIKAASKDSGKGDRTADFWKKP